jgi:hypothetical protein
LNIPYPESKEYFKLSISETIIQEDTLKYYIHLGKAIGNKGDGHVFFKDVEENDLKAFADVFCDTLNDIYSKHGNSLQPYESCITPLNTIIQFGFGPQNKLKYNFTADFSNLDEELKALVEDRTTNGGAVYKKVIRIVEPNEGRITFIKPNSIRYWLKSIALLDAKTSFSELRDMGF